MRSAAIQREAWWSSMLSGVRMAASGFPAAQARWAVRQRAAASSNGDGMTRIIVGGPGSPVRAAAHPRRRLQEVEAAVLLAATERIAAPGRA